jgi:hypothetical protein
VVSACDQPPAPFCGSVARHLVKWAVAGARSGRLLEDLLTALGILGCDQPPSGDPVMKWVKLYTTFHDHRKTVEPDATSIALSTLCHFLECVAGRPMGSPSGASPSASWPATSATRRPPLWRGRGECWRTATG